MALVAAMRVVVALGGNAILRRDQQMTVQNQRASIAEACEPLSRIAAAHELVVSHGNGPQIGLLALQAAAYDHLSEYPFDVLGASTEGMIGYLIEEELANRLGNARVVTTLVTRTEVDPSGPASPTQTRRPPPNGTAGPRSATARRCDGSWPHLSRCRSLRCGRSSGCSRRMRS
jgi:carbamate kinase